MMKAEFQKLENASNLSFMAYIYEVDSFDAPWHFHPEYELTYILKSKGMRYVGDSIEKFEEGDLVLIGPHLPHCWKNPENNTSARSMVVQWKDDFLGKDTMKKPEFYEIRSLLKQCQRGIKFDEDTAKELGNQLVSLHEKKPFEKLIALLCILRELCDVPHQVLSGTTFRKHQLKDVASNRINLVQNYVSMHYDKKIRLREAAGLVSLTEESFCKFFRQTMGRSFFNYLHEFRINMASRALLESNDEIMEISMACGYDSLPFFYRQFKKYKGISPLVYRKRYGEI